MTTRPFWSRLWVHFLTAEALAKLAGMLWIRETEDLEVVPVPIEPVAARAEAQVPAKGGMIELLRAGALGRRQRHLVWPVAIDPGFAEFAFPDYSRLPSFLYCSSEQSL